MFLALIFLQDPKSLPPGLPASLMNMINKSVAASGGGGKLSESVKPKVDTETPAQKQAAAKLALRKQLEKTLLQVGSAYFLSLFGNGNIIISILSNSSSL